MRDFGHELDRAMDTWIDKNCGSDIPGCPEETDGKIRNLLKQEERPVRKNRKKLTRWVGVIAACAVLMCSAVVVYAASPAVREYLNMLFLKEDSIQRLTEVPEGYTGIYTAEDLDNVRNDLYGNYILMNDIVLTEADYREGGIFEGGFVPIGAGKGIYSDNAFHGIFNGNGYVISGLCIEGDYQYAGLFSEARRSYDYVDADGRRHPVPPDGEYTQNVAGGMIKNLGVVDSVIRIEREAGTWTQEMGVGGIAGWADYVVGCFTDNTEISLTVKDSPHIASRRKTEYSDIILAGGIAGGANIVDSCYSGADIVLTTVDVETSNAFAAGVVGQSFACVTSYFYGTIDCGDYPDYGVAAHQEYKVPMVLSETVIKEIGRRLNERALAEGEITEGENSFDCEKFYAFYCSGEFLNFDLDYREFSTGGEKETMYLLDPETKIREHKVLNNLLDLAFPGNSFIQFCMDNNLKCGYYYCYDLREDPDCTFEGFDTESIWYIEDGRPHLRLFSGGTVGLSTESIGDRPRLGWQKGLFQTPIPGM